MDLEDFGDSELLNSTFSVKSDLLAQKALDLIDERWFVPATRRARWMDLLGDYAGEEHFILHGDALLEVVLDDPLLALGKDNDLGFSLPHALYSLEKLVSQFVQRKTKPDIVFFESTKHLSLATGASDYVVTSRALARVLLFNHLVSFTSSKIRTLCFESTQDTMWAQYLQENKPMFIMTNDGSSTSSALAEPESVFRRTLLQRIFLSDFLGQGIGVAILKGCEFRDQRILTFVYEGSGRLPAVVFPSDFISAIAIDLENLEGPVFDTFRPLSTSQVQEEQSRYELILDCCRYYLEHGNRSQADIFLLYVFALQAFVLGDIPLKHRAQALEVRDITLVRSTLQPFVTHLVISLLSCPGLSTHDVFDGRIFLLLLQAVFLHAEEGSVHTADLVGRKHYDRAEEIWTALQLPQIDLQQFPLIFQLNGSNQIITNSGTAQNQRAQTRPLLPFSNPAFDSQLSIVLLPTEEDLPSNPSELSKSAKRDDALAPSTRKHLDFGSGSGTLFLDNVHWHNNTKSILPDFLGGAKGSDRLPSDSKSRFWALKRHQQFTNRLQVQAGTLTGAFGKAFERIVIPYVQDGVVRKGQKRIEDKPQSRALSKKELAQPKLTSADKLRLKIAEEKRKVQSVKSDSWWSTQLAHLKTLSGSREKQEYLAKVSRSKTAGSDAALLAEITLYRVQMWLCQWIDDLQRDEESVADGYRVEVLRLIKDILEVEATSITHLVHKHVVSVLRALGFTSFADHLQQNATTTTKNENASNAAKLGFKFMKLSSRSNPAQFEFMGLKAGDDAASWQLRCFGEFMDRSMDGKPDSRVAFQPDAWQRDVLDSIDRDESSLVVAPTSAGKTFISFYAMERVLRGSNDGILVYICPTKALVTQVAAEVYARFSKILKEGCFWAVHTRDYRINDPQKCQILITVPEVLSIMLLSPPMARVWTPRLKRIILDEIHTIGQLDSGSVWEQILLLSPCPVIGLSATIGSPETFNTWLQAVQASHGHEHKFIMHPFRYSHLRKFYYQLQVGKNLEGLRFEALSSSASSSLPPRRCRFLHPVSMLSFGPRTLPADLALEARDTISLYHSLVSANALSEREMVDLHPNSYFAGTSSLLTQKDVIAYEEILKSKLLTLLATQNVRDEFAPLNRIVTSLQDPLLAKVPLSHLNQTPSREDFLKNLLHLVAELHNNDELPAILFSFDRSSCEVMAHKLSSALAEAEDEWKASSQEWKDKLAAWTQWHSLEKDRQRQAEKRLRIQKSKSRKKNEDDRDGDEHEDVGAGTETSPAWQSSFDPDAPLATFSFAGVSTGVDIDAVKKELRWMVKGQFLEEWIAVALFRGIAVHHAGMNKGYRGLVENLFRQRFIRVMISTSTLALGINAPTKTAVFCGDSPYLTALQYRQCAGRAGRRGYDLLGKVVFFGLPMERVQRLVVSRLPSLGGSFPLTSTLTLRLLNLLQGSANAEVASKAIKSIISLPQLGFDSETGQHQLLHHLRFSIEYLRRSRLIDDHGNALNLFGVAAHLYYHEPSNFALVALLRSGALHTIAKGSDREEAKKTLVLVLAHLFGRRYILPSFVAKINKEATRKRYPSKIILPPLPEFVKKALAEHDSEILEIFTTYATTCAKRYAENELGPEDHLPLSAFCLDSGWINRDTPGEETPFQARLRQNAISVNTRSQFVATSGHTDNFKSVSELANTARSGLHIAHHAIPTLEKITATPVSIDTYSTHSRSRNGTDVDQAEATHPLNAYILDYFIHGQVSTLAEANGIRRGDVWYLLQDFDLTLATIKSSLEHLFLQAEQNVAQERAGAGRLKSMVPSSNSRGDMYSPLGTESLTAIDGETGISQDDDETNVQSDDDDDDLTIEGEISRPDGVGDDDWLLYRLVAEVAADFRGKFKRMWA